MYIFSHLSKLIDSQHLDTQFSKKSIIKKNFFNPELKNKYSISMLPPKWKRNNLLYTSLKITETRAKPNNSFDLMYQV